MAENRLPPPQGCEVEIDRGDQWVRALLRDHAPKVRVLLRRRYPTFDASDLDDVLTIALTRFWLIRHRYEPEKASIRTYFCRIADSVVLDILKKGWHQARCLEVALGDQHPAAIARPEDSGDAGAVSDAGAGPEAIQGLSADSQLIQDLRKIIDSLPDNYRTIILADGCSRDRVASAELLSQELEIPAATVRVYRNRAMNMIRVSLRKLGYQVP